MSDSEDAEDASSVGESDVVDCGGGGDGVGGVV